MPKAPMHEYYFPESREHEIWTSGEIGRVKPVPESHPMDQTPNQHFGLCVPSSDTGHALASLLFGQVVHATDATLLELRKILAPNFAHSRDEPSNTSK